jgi:hypothetical protein
MPMEISSDSDNFFVIQPLLMTYLRTNTGSLAYLAHHPSPRLHKGANVPRWCPAVYTRHNLQPINFSPTHLTHQTHQQLQTPTHTSITKHPIISTPYSRKMCFSRNVTVHTLCSNENCDKILSTHYSIAYYCRTSPHHLPIPVDPYDNQFGCQIFPFSQDGVQIDKRSENGDLRRACYALWQEEKEQRMRMMTDDEWRVYNHYFQLSGMKLADDYLFSLPKR